MSKLNASEISLLKEINQNTRLIASNYPPLYTLLRHNLVERKSAGTLSAYQITQEGRSCLQEASKEALFLAATRTARTSTLGPNRSNIPKKG
jgi:predicted transcriptional regulator